MISFNTRKFAIKNRADYEWIKSNFLSKEKWNESRWNHEYIVKELQPGAVMTLAIKGDENETQEYVYVDAIPDSILDELTGVE